MKDYRSNALRLAYGLGQLAFGGRWSDAHRQVTEELVDAIASYAASLAIKALSEPPAAPAAPAPESVEERGMRQFEAWKRHRQNGGGHGRA